MSQHNYQRYDAQKLAALADLRREAGLSQSEVATFFGMKRWDSVSAWELGMSKPRSTRRSWFIVYLLDKLGLRNYQQFVKMWNDLMVEQWGWQPLSEDELKGCFPGTVTQPVSPRIPMQRPARVHYFIGHEAELAEILTYLQPGKVLALYGPGGIGKTALSAEALWNLAPGDEPPDRFPDGIVYYSFYDQSKSDLVLEHIVLSFGEKVGHSTPRDAARRVLAGKRALLVLDGTENADDLQAVLEVRGNCGVLVTSRRRESFIPKWQIVPTLSFDKAITLLQAWGGARASDEDAARQICALVGGLPLAIRIAGSYIAQAEQNAAEYLAWLEKTPLQALDQGERQFVSIPVLLQESLDRISESARQTLAVAGILALASFDREAVAAAQEVSIDKASQLLGELVSYSLLWRAEVRYMVSHDLVHTYASQRLEAPAGAVRRLAAYYAALANKYLYRALAPELYKEGWAKLENVSQHLDVLYHTCSQLEDPEALHIFRDEKYLIPVTDTLRFWLGKSPLHPISVNMSLAMLADMVIWGDEKLMRQFRLPG
jgi:hypothetical protein